MQRGRSGPALQRRIDRLIEDRIVGQRRGIDIRIDFIAEQRVIQRLRGRRCRIFIVGTAELVIVTLAPLGIAEDATRMIDEAQRFLDVALAIARLRVVLANQSAQRRPHFLVGGSWRNAQRIVERRFPRGVGKWQLYAIVQVRQ